MILLDMHDIERREESAEGCFASLLASACTIKILACSASVCMWDTGPVSCTSNDIILLELHDIDGEECLLKQGGSA